MKLFKKIDYLKLASIASSNWVITLTSTMFGVLLALYLSSYSEKKTLSEEKEKAMSQVYAELKENHTLLKNHYTLLSEKFKELNYIFSKLNEESEIIIHKDSVEVFKVKSGNTFEFTKAENFDDDFVRVKGYSDVNIKSPLMLANLSNITWESYKQTNYLTITDFTCLTGIENMYELQKEVNELNKSWRNNFFRGKAFENAVSREQFMSEWMSLLLKQEQMLNVFSFKDDVFESCK